MRNGPTMRHRFRFFVRVKVMQRRRWKRAVRAAEELSSPYPGPAFTPGQMWTLHEVGRRSKR